MCLSVFLCVSLHSLANVNQENEKRLQMLNTEGHTYHAQDEGAKYILVRTCTRLETRGERERERRVHMLHPEGHICDARRNIYTRCFSLPLCRCIYERAWCYACVQDQWEKNHPAATNLTLKVGAQVILLKNKATRGLGSILAWVTFNFWDFFLFFS